MTKETPPDWREAFGTLAPEEADEIAVYELFSCGEISEDVARALLGDKLDKMNEERSSFEAAVERDTSDFLTGRDSE